MGSSAAPKTFGNSTPFGASPTPPIATQTQPLATVTGTQTPALSGYNMQQQTAPTPATPALDSGVGNSDVLAQLRANRTNGGLGPGIMPFYG